LEKFLDLRAHEFLPTAQIAALTAFTPSPITFGLKIATGRGKSAQHRALPRAARKWLSEKILAPSQRFASRP